MPTVATPSFSSVNGMRDALLLLLTAVAGRVDTVGCIVLGHVFTANVTGNTILLYLAVVQADSRAALRSGPAPAGFRGGSAAAARVIRKDSSQNVWPTPVATSAARSTPGTTGAGLYFGDPNGQLLEIVTRPYGSGGTAASRPHPLVAPTPECTDHESRDPSHQGKSGGSRLAIAERAGLRDG